MTLPSTDVIQLTLTRKMTTAQVVETVLFRTTFTQTINAPPTYEITLGSNLSQLAKLRKILMNNNDKNNKNAHS